jgi:uncharacterized protein YceH (UPF0502 family)
VTSAHDVFLDPVEQRVLGALMEKQRTVPDSYPLTANALRSACNQTSNREPVTDLDEQTIHRTLAGLRDRELIRFVHTGSGSRVVRFHQRLTERLELDEPTAAVLTVMLLRGPQAPGELRTRTDRLHPFADREAVEALLSELAERDVPLVVRLERKPGQHDHRWAHLLGPLPADAAEPVSAAVDRESVLAEGTDARDVRVLAAYDASAAGYAEALDDELSRKPFDTWLLERIVRLAPDGPVVDVGCGPGQVAAFLAQHDRQTSAVDLSPAMVDQVRGRHPEIDVWVGDLTGLMRPRAAAGWSAVTAWYSLVHLVPSELPGAVGALARVLVPGGVLAVAVHAGTEVHHADDLFGAAVDVDFVLHGRDEVLTAFAGAGLTGVEWYLRGSDATVEVETERLYVLARRS